MQRTRRLWFADVNRVKTMFTISERLLNYKHSFSIVFIVLPFRSTVHVLDSSIPRCLERIAFIFIRILGKRSHSRTRFDNTTRIFYFQRPLTLIIFWFSQIFGRIRMLGVNTLQKFFPLMVLFTFKSRKVASRSVVIRLNSHILLISLKCGSLV